MDSRSDDRRHSSTPPAPALPTMAATHPAPPPGPSLEDLAFQFEAYVQSLIPADFKGAERAPLDVQQVISEERARRERIRRRQAERDAAAALEGAMAGAGGWVAGGECRVDAELIAPPRPGGTAATRKPSPSR